MVCGRVASRPVFQLCCGRSSCVTGTQFLLPQRSATAHISPQPPSPTLLPLIVGLIEAACRLGAITMMPLVTTKDKAAAAAAERGATRYLKDERNSCTVNISCGNGACPEGRAAYRAGVVCFRLDLLRACGISLNPEHPQAAIHPVR